MQRLLLLDELGEGVEGHDSEGQAKRLSILGILSSRGENTIGEMKYLNITPLHSSEEIRGLEEWQ